MPSATTSSDCSSLSSSSAWVCRWKNAIRSCRWSAPYSPCRSSCFPWPAGYFADRFSKRNVAVAIKCAELGIMSVVTLGLWLENIPLMLAAIFLMSTHSAIFGPTKYGMLPELLPEKRLSWGNGIFGLGHLFRQHRRDRFSPGAVGPVRQKADLLRRISPRAGAASACRCALVSRACPPPIRGRNSARIFWAISFRSSRQSAATAILFLGVDGQHVPVVSRRAAATGHGVLRQGHVGVGRHAHQLFAGGACSRLGAGSLSAGFLSGGKIEYGLIPLGMAGLTIFAATLLYIAPTPAGRRAESRLAGFLRRILQRAGQCHHPTSPRCGQKRRGHRRSRVVGLDRDAAFASGVYYLLKAVCT